MAAGWYLGDTEISSAYVGDDQVAIYLGDTELVARGGTPDPGAAIYQAVIAAATGSVLHGRFTVGRTTGSDRNVYWPGDANPVGEFINSDTPTGTPNMPIRMRFRTTGSSAGRMTMSFESGTTSPSVWLHNGGTTGRYFYLITVNTHGTAPDQEHEWVRIDTTRTSGAGRIGGTTWANIHSGLNTGELDRVNVAEDLAGGRLAGVDRTASLATATAYNTWIGEVVRLETGDPSTEFVLAFSESGTYDPNA